MKVNFLSLTLALLMLLSTVIATVSCNTTEPIETEGETLPQIETSAENEADSTNQTSAENDNTEETEGVATSETSGNSGSEYPTESVTENESETHTEVIYETEAETYDNTLDESESDKTTVTEAESFKEIESEKVTETDTEPTKETESEKVSETDTEPTKETESEKVSETEGEPEITVEKTVSHSAGKTVYPGELITYSFVLKNNGTGKGTINITDTLPSNTEYVSGADRIDGTNLSWSVTVNAGETKTVSYTVKVKNDLSLCDGGTVTPGACKAGELDLQTHSLYIERTLNATDQQYFDIAFRALKRSEYFTGFNLYRWMYGVAFTYAQAVSGAISIANDTPAEIMDAIANGTANETVLDMVAPGLYGGTSITGSITGVKGTPGEVTKDDLISGDGILRTKDGKTELFVYSNSGFCNLTGECEDADLDEVLASLSTSEKYAVLRPSSNLIDFTPSDINEKTRRAQRKASGSHCHSILLSASRRGSAVR